MHPFRSADKKLSAIFELKSFELVLNFQHQIERILKHDASVSLLMRPNFQGALFVVRNTERLSIRADRQPLRSPKTKKLKKNYNLSKPRPGRGFRMESLAKLSIQIKSDMATSDRAEAN